IPGQIRAALMTRDALVLVLGSEVAGVDPSSGERLWSQPLEHGTCTSDGISVVCADDGGVAERAADTGAQLGRLDVTDATAATRWSGDWFVLRDDAETEQGELVRYSDDRELWSTPVGVESANIPFGNIMTVQAGRVLLTTITGTDSPAGTLGGVFDASTGA